MATLEEKQMIAEFMGWKKIGNRFDMTWKDGDWERNRSIKETEFNYHSNWNQLMPVWIKIRKLQPLGFINLITFSDFLSLAGAWIERGDIENAYKTIVNILKWYNALKPEDK